jgi:hypothetical protein
MRWVDIAQAASAIIVAVFSGLLVIVGYLQVKVYRRQAKIMDTQADILRATQRAFVHVKSIVATPLFDANGVLRVLKVSPEWENSGTTPTRGLRISINWTPYPSDLPRDFPYDYGRPPTRLFLGPKGTSHAGTIDIPPNEVENARSGRARIFIWGRAEYSDVFDSSHHTQFCFRLDIQTVPSAADWMGFVHYGDYNGSDEDIY